MKHSAEDLAFEAYDKGNYEDAYPVLSRLAEEGDVQSLLAVGWMCETGAVHIPDPETARKYYQRAADSGSADAINRLGRLLLSEGYVVQARSTFELGAERGITSCMYHLGRVLLRNPTNENDAENGIKCLEKAANRGHLFAKRQILSIKWSSTNSIFTRSFIFLKVVLLISSFLKEGILNPNSDLLA